MIFYRRIILPSLLSGIFVIFLLSHPTPPSLMTPALTTLSSSSFPSASAASSKTLTLVSLHSCRMPESSAAPSGSPSASSPC